MLLLPSWQLRRRMTFPAAVSKILILEREGGLKMIKDLLHQVCAVLLTDLRVWVSQNCSLIILSLASEEPRKRRSRWGEASQKVELPGLPTAISSANISQAQLDNYAIQLRLEEINRKLRLNDYVPSERER
jgi:hypothetical protein